MPFQWRSQEPAATSERPRPHSAAVGDVFTTQQLHDDCLGRTLDWFYEHDATALLAGLARQARQHFGIAARQVHVDTTSFCVAVEYAPDLEAQTLAIAYG